MVWTPGWWSSGRTWWSWSPPSCGPMWWTGCVPWPRAEGERKRTVAGKPVRPTNAIDQTRRMLSLVTYLRERPGARVEDVAHAFGITEDELVSDLDVLPMCGTSFRGGDLLDIDTDGERIWWHNPDDVAEPLRLAADEATALLVAARAVASSAASLSGSATSSRSEEHTSELQSHVNLVCRLLLEKKKTRRY